MSGGTREDHGNLHQESRRSVWGSKQAGCLHITAQTSTARAGRSALVQCGTDRVSAASRLAGSSFSFVFELRGYLFLAAAIIHYCLPQRPLQSASQYRQTDRRTLCCCIILLLSQSILSPLSSLCVAQFKSHTKILLLRHSSTPTHAIQIVPHAPHHTTYSH